MIESAALGVGRDLCEAAGQILQLGPPCKDRFASLVRPDAATGRSQTATAPARAISN